MLSCVMFLILEQIFHFELVLSFWVDFVILDRTPNIGLKVHFVILDSFGRSGMSSSFDNFDILGWISHSGTILSFWAEFIILY